MANSLAELIGLGFVASVVFAFLRIVGEPTSAVGMIGFAALAVGLGAVEGLVVGCAQFTVLRSRLPRLRGWVRATVVGAVIAWTAGMIPSTLSGILSPEGSEPPPEVSDGLQILLAIPIGLIAGVLLSLPQWWVLRKYVSYAGWWVAANALAWALSMPVIFLIAGATPTASGLLVALTVALGLALAGAVVGATHGAFLVRLLSLNSPGSRRD